MLRLKDYQLKASTIKELIAVQSSLGDKPLVYLEDDVLTYAQANERANRIANSLLMHGLRKGDLIATYLANSLDHVCFWFACAKIGAIWAPMNIALVRIDLAYTINDIRPRAVVIDESLSKNYLEIRDEISCDNLLEIFRGASEAVPSGWIEFATLYKGADREPAIEVHWNDLASLIFTGGSTGLPKGVMVSNAWYFPGVYRYFEMFRPDQNDVHFGLGQLYHTIGSAVDILAPMYFGMSTVITKWFSASKFWEVGRERNTTVSVMIGPAMMALLSQPQAPDDASNPLRLIGTATGIMPREMVDEFKSRFAVDTLELYGQTETGPLGCVSQRLDDRPYHSLGTANGWADVIVADLRGVEVPRGSQGEILLRTRYPSSFMQGYYNHPEKFAEACRDLWFHTGDIGYMDESGYLFYCDRAAHLIRCKGENVSAIEVEKVLLSHHSISNCAVVGVPSTMGDEEIKAYIELKEGTVIAPLDLIKYCEERIAFYKVPRYVEFVTEFPRSVTKGDIERFKLKKLGVAQAWDSHSTGYKVRRLR